MHLWFCHIYYRSLYAVRKNSHCSKGAVSEEKGGGEREWQRCLHVLLALPPAMTPGFLNSSPLLTTIYKFMNYILLHISSWLMGS